MSLNLKNFEPVEKDLMYDLVRFVYQSEQTYYDVFNLPIQYLLDQGIGIVTTYVLTIFPEVYSVGPGICCMLHIFYIPNG